MLKTFSRLLTFPLRGMPTSLLGAHLVAGLIVCGLASNAFTGGPIIIGGDDMTEHGEMSIELGPASGVVVPETEPNDIRQQANPISLGDDFTGELLEAVVGPASGEMTLEMEPNDDPSTTTDSMGVGDDYIGEIPPIDVGPFSGVIVDESEPNDDISTADTMELGDNYAGELSPLVAAPGTGNTVDESEPNDDAEFADVMIIGDDYAGDINEVTDQDLIAFESAGDDSLVVNILNGPGLCSTLQVLNPDGVTVRTQSSTCGTTNRLAFNLPSGPDTYFLKMVSLNQGFTGTYTLQLRNVTTPTDTIDTVAFTVPGPTSITVNRTGISHRLILFDTNGATQLANICCSSTVPLFAELPAGGTYFLQVQRISNNSGPYTLELRACVRRPLFADNG